jgi:hypothetical protein
LESGGRRRVDLDSWRTKHLAGQGKKASDRIEGVDVFSFETPGKTSVDTDREVDLNPFVLGGGNPPFGKILLIGGGFQYLTSSRWGLRVQIDPVGPRGSVSSGKDQRQAEGVMNPGDFSQYLDPGLKSRGI